MYKFLELDDRDSIKFLINAKRRILVFHSFGENEVQFPLNEIKVEIKDILNLLKTFSFTRKLNLIKEIEKFKKNII